MKRKVKKPNYLRVRLPVIPKIGGTHEPAKGGRYNRRHEKRKTREEVGLDLSNN